VTEPCGAHQRQAGRDGETDDDEQPELTLVRNVDCKSCIHKSSPINNKLAIITMLKLARSS